MIIKDTQDLMDSATHLEVEEVTSKPLMHEFADFVLKLYKDCPQYVPYLYSDEVNMLDPKFNITLKDCDTKYFLCRQDGIVVGRVGAICQNKYNSQTGKRDVRFTRFDCIDNQAVANALINAVENFARERNMQTVSGPYGFNETDRAGYLFEGFEKSANFGTNYNFSYYDRLLKNCGYDDDCEWLELILQPSDFALEKFSKLSDYCQKRYGYTLANEKSFSSFAKKYGWKSFQCLNKAYKDLPGFIPFEYDLYEQIRKQFSIALKPQYMSAVLDKNDNVVGFAVCFPSLADAMKKTKGKLFPFGFITVLASIAKPKSLDLCLIGVDPAHQSKGVNAVLIAHILQTIKREGIQHCEAYPQLKENTKTLSQWQHFNADIARRRKTVTKKL